MVSQSDNKPTCEHPPLLTWHSSISVQSVLSSFGEKPARHVHSYDPSKLIHELQVVGNVPGKVNFEQKKFKIIRI